MKNEGSLAAAFGAIAIALVAPKADGGEPEGRPAVAPADLAILKEHVTAKVRSGAMPAGSYVLGGMRLRRARFVSADDEKLRVRGDGVETDVRWSSLGPEDIYKLARPAMKDAPARALAAHLHVGVALGLAGDADFQDRLRTLEVKDAEAAKAVRDAVQAARERLRPAGPKERPMEATEAGATDVLGRPIPPLELPRGRAVRVADAPALKRAIERAREGDVILVADGEYRVGEFMYMRGKRNVTVCGESMDPAKVVIFGRGWAKRDTTDDILRIGDCENVTIAHVTFRDCQAYALKVEAENFPKNVTVHNCHFYDFGTRGIKGSTSRDGVAAGGSVRFCYFENTRVPPADWLFGGDYVSSIDMMALDGWTFADNVFKNVKGRRGGARGAIFVWVRSKNLVVERNLMIDCDRGIALGNPSGSTAEVPGMLHVSDSVCRNNVVKAGPDAGIELAWVEGVRVENNTVWCADPGDRGIRCIQRIGKVEIAGNLVRGRIDLAGGATQSGNVTGALEGFFADPARGDLSLTARATSAVNAGTGLAGLDDDFFGARRDARPDAGAVEFGAKRPRAAAGAASKEVPSKDGEPWDWASAQREVGKRFGGTPGVVVILGDSNSYANQATRYARGGQGHSPEERAVLEWSHSGRRNETDGWWLTSVDVENGRSHTSSSGVRADEYIRGGKHGLPSLDEIVRKYNPQVAFVALGTNDASAGIEPDAYAASMAAIVDRLYANGTMAIVLTVPPHPGRNELVQKYNERIYALGREKRFAVADVYAAFLERRPGDTWDGTLTRKGDVHFTFDRCGGPATEENLASDGYLLRCWVMLGKLIELKRRAID